MLNLELVDGTFINKMFTKHHSSADPRKCPACELDQPSRLHAPAPPPAKGARCKEKFDPANTRPNSKAPAPLPATHHAAANDNRAGGHAAQYQNTRLLSRTAARPLYIPPARVRRPAKPKSGGSTTCNYSSTAKGCS